MELDATAAGNTPAETSVALAPGKHLGKYRLTRILGEGGMGVVWAAHDPDLERSVAIKVLRYAEASVQLRQRLLREARAMAKLKHPNVLTVYEVGTVGDRDYIAMELVEGTSLDRWLAAGPPQEEVWSAILASGRGLAAAHERGVVHRDFKPHNVLRSRDGRVLVTDFGLARGLLGEEDSAAVDEGTPLPEPSTTPALDATLQAPSKSASPSRDSDSLLDAPLTQTGALIGTPAYMAPEQYFGTAPDPRTDQFAFCVTAWQAFTGERPFKGATLDEMRKAVGGGVAHIATPRLAKAVRAVLVRGLDPRAEARWPSLEVLLDELERAGKRPRQRKIAMAMGAGVIALAGAVAFMLLRRDSQVVHACDAPEAAFAEAWSPVLRAELARTSKAPAAAFERVATVYDQFRERWVESYQKTCRAKTAKTFPARIRCLENVRDQVSAMTFMLKSAPAQVYEQFDPHGIMPHLGSCDRAVPDDTPLTVPREQPMRSQVIGLLARSIALRGLPTEQLDAAVAALEREATVVGWQPAIAGVLVTSAGSYLQRGMVDNARALYSRALVAARAAKDHKLEAVIRLGELEASMLQLARPNADPPPKLDDPRAAAVMHPELASAFTIARSVTQEDPMLLGSVAVIAASAHTSLAQWNRYRGAYADALAHAQEARKQFESMGDIRRAARSAAIEAQIYLLRGDDRALDDALFTSRRAADALESAKLPPLPLLDEALINVAFARPDYKEVHRIYDKYGRPSTNVATNIKGRVTPPGRARVIAWRGELAGDPRRGYTDPSSVEMDVVEADADGTFEIRAQPGWAIVAEAGDTRSAPQVIAANGTPVLSLAPVTALSGTARGKNFLGVRAFAMFKAGASAWQVHVPIERDGSFNLRGLPTGAPYVLGATGTTGDGTRRVVFAPGTKDLVWPYGQAVEVIIRSREVDDAAQVWIFRGATPTSRTRAAIERTTAPDVATASAHPVGASNTDAGREHYKLGDRHAVITGNADGSVTACAAARGGDDAPVACRTFNIEASVILDYPDGRFASGVTPIVLEP